MWLNVIVKRMQEIIASMSGSRLDPLPGHYRQRVLEDRLGEDDSGTSSTELRRVSLLLKSAVDTLGDMLKKLFISSA